MARKLEAKGLGAQYTRMRQNSFNPHSAPLRRTSAKVDFDDPIKDYRVWPIGEKPEKDISLFIKLNVSVRALVEDNMAEIEDNYAKHALGSSSYIDKSDGELEQMKSYFFKDKLGLEPIDQSDGRCWKVVTVTTGTGVSASTFPAAPSGGAEEEAPGKDPDKYSPHHGDGEEDDSDFDTTTTRKQAIMTSFCRDLRVIQKSYYMFLRGSIPLYMDDGGQKFYKTMLLQEDANRDLSMAEKYMPGKRIPWKWIKEMIYTKMSCRTNGNYFYKPMLTMYRTDNLTRWEWCDLVTGVYDDMVEYGNGYDKLGSRDAVEKLWDWLCPEDEQPVVREYYKRSHSPQYMDAQTILGSVTLKELVEAITIKIDTSEWPTKRPFKNSRCKAGRAKLLYTHAHVQRLNEKVAELQNSRGANSRRANKAPSDGEQSDPDVFPIMDESMEAAVFADEGYNAGGGGKKKAKQKRKRKKRRSQIPAQRYAHASLST